jgi:outer membrane protein assembly factor BamB
MKPVVTPGIAARSPFAMPMVLVVALSSAPAAVAAPDQDSPASRGWTVPLNGGLSSPSVVDGTVYVGTRDGTEASSPESPPRGKVRQSQHRRPLCLPRRWVLSSS